MELKFYYNEYNVLDVDSKGKYQSIADVLTDNNHESTIGKLLNAVDFVRKNNEDWDMSFNKSFVNININRVQCGDLFDEDEHIEMSLKQFTNVLKSWRVFITSKESSKEITF